MTYEYFGFQWFNAFGHEQIWLFKADNIFKMIVKWKYQNFELYFAHFFSLGTNGQLIIISSGNGMSLHRQLTIT